MKKKNPKSVGSQIIAGLNDLLKTMQSGEQIGDKFTVRRVKLNLKPVAFNSKAVKLTRELLNVSQAVFAQFLGVSVKTVHSWESGSNDPSPMACRFMDEIQRNPDYWRKRLKQSMELKV